MVDLRKCEDEKSKQHWAFVEATSNIVRRWPRWKVAAAGLCPLCELGLTSDATAWPKYKELVAQYAQEGREIVIVVLNRVGQLLFQRTNHERYIN